MPAGAYEFGTYLPVNTQSVLIQPIGEEGILVMASDYQRGFGRVDQVRLRQALMHSVLGQMQFFSRCCECLPVCPNLAVSI